MELSVVVATLNGRERLAASLDALGATMPDAEVIVANGPSTDGTSGMVREHPAADVLVELAERNLNAARNAGIAAATGDVIAFVGEDTMVEASWPTAVREAMSGGADVVTGPVHRSVTAGVTTESVETRAIAGREVTYFDGGNVAFSRESIEALDGFDEYLGTGGARDAAHRLAGMGRAVAWESAMSVLRRDRSDVADRMADEVDVPVVATKFRALAYRLVKNYGPRPTVAARTAKHAFHEAGTDLLSVVRGDEVPSAWLHKGRSVLSHAVVGVRDGLLARAADRSPTRNPNGVSSRVDRAVEQYDWR